MTIIIIGNGIAGSTAARFIRKNSSHQIIMISNESDFPFARTAMMYVYMGQLTEKGTHLYEDDFWSKNRIERIKGEVKTILTTEKQVILEQNQSISYDKLIIASGSLPQKIGVKGEELAGVSSFYHLQDLQKITNYTSRIKNAIIIGGGLIGIELAEMFWNKRITVDFLVREARFGNSILPIEEAIIIENEIRRHQINLHTEQEIEEIIGDGSGKVVAVLTKKGQEIRTDFVGVAIGVRPNIAFLEQTNIATNIGILVDDFLKTNIDDIYAIGDCVELRAVQGMHKNTEAVWYIARKMGEIVAQTITGNETKYQPTMWYNSAKFFSIEYQVYGFVPNQDTTNTDSLYWENEIGTKSIRLVYDRQTTAILGFQVLGIRYRQAICEAWILAQTPIEAVVKNLKKANFDPEFYTRYEGELVHIYELKTGKKMPF